LCVSRPKTKLILKKNRTGIALSDRGVEMHRSCGPMEPSPGPNHCIQYQASDPMSQAKSSGWAGLGQALAQDLLTGQPLPFVLLS